MKVVREVVNMGFSKRRASGVKPSYDYDLHNQLLSNESDTIVQIANRNSKIKMSILTLS